jgi:hypothetical protein
LRHVLTVPLKQRTKFAIKLFSRARLAIVQLGPGPTSFDRQLSEYASGSYIESKMRPMRLS